MMAKDTQTTARGARMLRRFGVSLIEAIFYLTVTASVLTLTARIIDREATREQNEAFASDLRQMIAATRSYAEAYGDDLRTRLFDATANPADELVTDIPIDVLVDNGLIPPLFGQAGGSGLAARNDKEYRIWARGVLHSEIGTGAAPVADPTATRLAVEDLGALDPDLADNDLSNDELQVEMVLVTRDRATPPGGDPVFNRADGNRIVAETGLPTAGFIGTTAGGAGPPDVLARGAYGAWELNLRPYDGLGAYAPLDQLENNFAGLISIPVHGVLSRAAAPMPQSAEDMFARCAALPDGHPSQDECYESAGIWTNMIFEGMDVDGDGNVDRFPGIENVFEIAMTDPTLYPTDGAVDAEYADVANIRGLTILRMRDPFASGADGDNLDVFPAIENVTRLSMGRQGSDGIPAVSDALGRIQNLHGVSCTAGGSVGLTSHMSDGVMVFDCDETVFSEVISVTTPDPVGEPDRRQFNVAGDARLQGAVALRSTAPISLNLDAGTGGVFSRLGSQEVTLSDPATGDFLRLRPGEVAAGGRVSGTALTLSTGALNLGGDGNDVRQNLLRRPVARVVSADGNPASFAIPSCSGMPLFEVLSVYPPDPVSRGHDLLRDVDVSHNPPTAGGTVDVDVEVTYADVTATATNCTFTRREALFEYQGSVDNIVHNMLDDPPEDRRLSETEGCDFQGLDEDSFPVTNPAGTRVIALVGCQ